MNKEKTSEGIREQNRKELIDDERLEIVSILKNMQFDEEERYKNSKDETEETYHVHYGKLNGLQVAINLVKNRLGIRT